jgi:hypothetical protein
MKATERTATRQRGGHNRGAVVRLRGQVLSPLLSVYDQLEATLGKVHGRSLDPRTAVAWRRWPARWWLPYKTASMRSDYAREANAQRYLGPELLAAVIVLRRRLCKHQAAGEAQLSLDRLGAYRLGGMRAPRRGVRPPQHAPPGRSQG